MLCNFFTALQRASGRGEKELIFARVQPSLIFTVKLKHFYLNNDLQD